jgi:hypothetical protein
VTYSLLQVSYPAWAKMRVKGATVTCWLDATVPVFQRSVHSHRAIELYTHVVSLEVYLNVAPLDAGWHRYFQVHVLQVLRPLSGDARRLR